jgi:hypothetical protein
MAPLASLAALAVPAATRSAPVLSSADPVEKAEPAEPALSLLSAAPRPSTSSQQTTPGGSSRLHPSTRRTAPPGRGFTLP